MAGKYENEVAGLAEKSFDIWRPFFHRQYETGTEGGMRRAYMELAKPPFYPKIFEVVNIKPEETVLDAGCGDGTDMIYLHEEGHTGLMVGLETPVSENREATENKFHYIRQRLATGGIKKGPVANAELKAGYAEEMDFADESFDTILAANTLQECYDIDTVLDQFFRVLRPGGKLIIVTNHVENKPLHHGILREKAEKIDGQAPLPHSHRFNSVTGPIIMSRHQHQFRFRHEVIQQGINNLRLTEQEVPYLLASLSTYWPDIKPKNAETITKDGLMHFLYQLQSRRVELIREVEEEVLAKINASPDKAIYETIKRVCYFFNKRSKPEHLVMKSINFNR
jgi:SAM-dependent methyltransferase